MKTLIILHMNLSPEFAERSDLYARVKNIRHAQHYLISQIKEFKCWQCNREISSILKTILKNEDSLSIENLEKDPRFTLSTQYQLTNLDKMILKSFVYEYMDILYAWHKMDPQELSKERIEQVKKRFKSCKYFSFRL